MALAYAIIMNCAMQIEREQTLKAESHQRTADRQGYANGFKPKALRTRVGEVHLRILQTCDYHDEEGRPFYRKSLDRGVRSERAMTLAVAEMYVQGVSTRKVTKIVEQLCGVTTLDNLCLSCFRCNAHKGPNLASVDPATVMTAQLFHPRRARGTSISIGTGLFWRVTRRRKEQPFDASRSTTPTRSFSENC